eukprot:CAMPEP_0176144302 /NCGR_PEP_ID=MMETSP0120_2-20121206/73467_1 /TAXON_ID=160619 /ORGANISM="Kryptoperidinium foliaceum, Strain CCMP 1326" /LENGTH=49 /DNA_ID= /DNA_START= /DNA_END= /DNA_ORIENTATION=
MTVRRANRVFVSVRELILQMWFTEQWCPRGKARQMIARLQRPGFNHSEG